MKFFNLEWNSYTIISDQFPIYKPRFFNLIQLLIKHSKWTPSKNFLKLGNPTEDKVRE